MIVELPVRQLEMADVLCDRCGESCKKKDDPALGPEYSTFTGSWGYNSKKDGTQQEAHFCESCSDFIVKLMERNGVRIRIHESIWYGTNVLSWLTEDRVGMRMAERANLMYLRLLHAEVVKYSKRYVFAYLAEALHTTPTKLKKFFAVPGMIDLVDKTHEYARVLGVDQQMVAREISREFKKEIEKQQKSS